MMVGRVLVVAWLFWAAVAHACGGPETYALGGPLASPEQLLTELVEPDDGFERTLIPELRFLYPFWRLHPRRVAALWRATYGDVEPGGNGDAPTWSACPADAGDPPADLTDARRRARRVLAKLMEEPSSLHEDCNVPFQHALEVLELAPALRTLEPSQAAAIWRGDDLAADVVAALPAPLRTALALRRLDHATLLARTPAEIGTLRAPTVRWVALQEALRTGIPDGWRDDVAKQTSPDTWPRLSGLHDAWLADFPQHPLADLVRLSRMRIGYFHNDPDTAWRAALGVYPRRFARLAQELRYLVYQNVLPTDLSAIERDPLLRTALAYHVPLDDARWNAWWRRAGETSDARLALNLQERLLARAATDAGVDRPLPAAFPAVAARPSALWARLRLIALVRSGRLAEASVQADALRDDPGSAVVRAGLALRRSTVADAARTPGLADEPRRYLVRVLADDASLATLAADADSALRADAAMTRAVRRLARDGWDAALQDLDGLPPARRANWVAAARLARDRSPAGRLALARHLRAHDGELFFGRDAVWYRSLNIRLDAARCERCPDSQPGVAPPAGCEYCGDRTPRDAAVPIDAAHEGDAIAAHLEQTSETYLALRAYADWLRQAPANDPQLRHVVAEADRAYNELVNWDAWNSTFWTHRLQDGDVAQAIRRAGVAARQRR